MSTSAPEPSSTDGLTVTAIVPTHNRAEFLGEALSSLVEQTRPPDEIVVINDASTDQTSEVLDAFGGAIERVDLVENVGKASALNTIIPGVSGEFVWLFDDDDVALPDALERHVAKLAEEPTLDFTYSDVVHSADPDIWNDDAWRINHVPDAKPEEFLYETMFSMHTLMQGMLIRRTSLESIGLFDPTFDRCQDLEMLIRLAAECRGAKVDNEPTFVYREHDANRGGTLASHAGSDRLRVSNEYRKEVFRKTRNELPLDSYLRHIEDADVSHDAAGLEAASLAQRGCLLIHQGLVDEGLEDLDLALSHPGIGTVNRGWLASALSSALDVEPWIFDSRRSLVMRLAEILNRNDELRISRDFMRGLYWSLRRELDNRNITQTATAATMLLLFLLRCGAYGAVDRLIHKTGA